MVDWAQIIFEEKKQHTTLRKYSAQKESLHIPLGYKSNRLIRKKNSGGPKN